MSNIKKLINKLNEKTKILNSNDDAIFEDIQSVTIKEDGKTVYLIKLNASDWYILFKNHDHNDKLEFNNSMSYLELFFSITKCEINEFANNLLTQLNNYDISFFVLELCSPKIRNVKIYDNDELYLVSAYDIFLHEININTKLSIPNIKNLTLIEYKNPFTYNHFLDGVINLSLKDISIEGIVISTKQNDVIKKYKILNPYFIVQHTLKYYGWSCATPQMIVPLILNKKDHEVIYNVKKCIDGDKLFSFQIGEICEFYNNKIENEYNCVVIVINDLIEQKKKLKGILSDSQMKNKYMCYIAMTYPSIYTIWKDFFEEIYVDLNEIKNKKSLPLNDAFKKHMLLNLNKIFTKNDYSVDLKHPSHYCEQINVDMENLNEDYPNDGKSLKKTHCYCGSKMNIKKIIGCLTRYKFCHCDKIFGYEVFVDGTYLAICSNEECSCVQKINQDTKEIIGMPCSLLCQALQNNLIEKSNEDVNVINNYGISKCINKLIELKTHEVNF